MRLLLVAVLFILWFPLFAQKAFQFENSISVNNVDTLLPMPFAGGINAAQIQSMDVNGDGREELIVLDRNADNLLVFEKEGEQYVHRPLMTYYFPEDINSFLMLVDYDKDGKKDLFTSSPFGIKAYRNSTPSDSYLQWEVAQEFLKLDNKSNLQTNNLDIPAILDIDGDMDLDIVTFNFASGDFLEFYQNTSVERKGIPDIDGFASAVTRWGGFEFCSCDNFAFGHDCSESHGHRKIPDEEGYKIEHAGGHSILLHDFNGDGNLDMLMGQDECNSLYFLANEGDNKTPDFNSFSKDLPQLDALPEFPIFHAAFLWNNDLIITTNSPSSAAQNQADYGRSIYHYDKGSSLTTNAFLQEDMLDLGENTRPFFKGNAASGELIVTANSLHGNKIVGKAFHFNVSTSGWVLDNEDYLNLSSLDLTDLEYQEYWAADNKSSLFVSGVTTENFTSVRKLLWSPNFDGRGFQEISLPEIQMRGHDQLKFYHHQGQDYLLLARQTGELIRYRMEFSTVPQLELLDRNYLGFSDNPATRNLSVHVVEAGDGLDLYVVDQRGILGHQPDFHTNTDLYTDILQIEEKNKVQTRLGRHTWLTSIPSAFGESQNLILGNTAGGLIHLAAISASDNPSDQEELQMKIYPNPTHGPLHIISSASGEITLFNVLGQIVLQDIDIEQNIPLSINTQHLSSGVYFVQLISNSGKRITKKLVINKM